MAPRITKAQAQDFCEMLLVDALVDPEGIAWRNICKFLDAQSDDSQLREELSGLAMSYFRDLNKGLYNKGRAQRIDRILSMVDGLTLALADERYWLKDRLFSCVDDPPNVDPVAEMSVQEILEGEDGNVLIALRTMVAHAIENAKLEMGQGLIRARRRAWIRAAQIYEERLDRRAATSKNQDGKIDPNGPFVKYILILSEKIMYADKITPDTIDKFVDWYRSAESKQDREEITLFRMHSALVRDRG